MLIFLHTCFLTLHTQIYVLYFFLTVDFIFKNKNVLQFLVIFKSICYLGKMCCQSCRYSHTILKFRNPIFSFIGQSCPNLCKLIMHSNEEIQSSNLSVAPKENVINITVF